MYVTANVIIPALTSFTVDVPPPWLARVAMIKAAASYNADIERKVIKLTEEVKDMLREIKIRVSGVLSTWIKLILGRTKVCKNLV